MRSIFDILYKNFQEDQLNSRRFPGFPGVVDTLVLLGAQNLFWTAQIHDITVDISYKYG